MADINASKPDLRATKPAAAARAGRYDPPGMNPRRTWRSNVRPAAQLSLAFTGFSYIVFLAPVLIEPFRYPPIAYVANVASVLPHLALFPALYLAIFASVSWPRLPRFGALAVAVLACAYLHASLDIMLLKALFAALAPGLKPPVNLSINVIIYVWLYAFFAAIVGLMISNEAMRIRERQLAEARAAAQEAQLAALRFQLNPHFLFNTLNAISSLILKQRNAEAEQMMEKLSDFLRASLAADPNRAVTLAEELDTILAYLDIEKVRFGDRLVVEIDCPAGLGSASVACFLLQPLVENAVKYAVAPSRTPVRIAISARRAGDDLVLTIADNGAAVPHAVAAPGAGVGLANVRARLEVLYGDRGRLAAEPTADGFACVVTLPFETEAGRVAAE